MSEEGGVVIVDGPQRGCHRRGAIVHERRHEAKRLVARGLDGHAAAASQDRGVVASRLWDDVEDVSNAEKTGGELETLLQRLVALNGCMSMIMKGIDILGEAGGEGTFGEISFGIGFDIENAGNSCDRFLSLYRRCVPKNTSAKIP